MDSRTFRDTKKEAGYEIHHIVPRCWDGEDEEWNLVKLTYREHFLAHYLLAKAFPEDEKLSYAFLCMVRNPHGHRALSSVMYSSLKKHWTKFRRKKWTEDNPMWKESAKKLHSERMKHSNPMTKEPWKNHTASPVRVHYVDGTTEDFTHMKQITELKGIPYDTLKYASRKNQGSPKWGIHKLEKLSHVPEGKYEI